MRAAACRAFGGKNFGQHATAADGGAGTPCHFFQPHISRQCIDYQRGCRILARISRIKASLIGEDDQAICLDQIGDQRTQRIVVAETDFIRDYRVVLVDDGYDIEFKQRAQG
jgi:hypothetical protein